MSRDRDIVPVEEHDIRIVEALYGEREADDSDAADLAAYDEIRDLFRSLPEADPPAGVSAKLLAAAAEAASARPGAASERPGLWARLVAWFEPVGRHPALAAVASLVLVVAIGGGLYMSGRSEMAEPEKDVAAPRSAPESTTAPATDTADLPATAQPGPVDEKELPQNESAAPRSGEVDNAAADEARPTGHTKGTRLERQRTERKPAPKRRSTRRPGRVLSGKLDLGSESDGTRARGNRGPALDKKAKDEKPRPRLQGKTKAPSPAPQAPPPPTSSPSTAADDDVDSNARLDGLTAKARKAAAAGDCARTRRIGDQVRAADGRYYDTVFLDDGAIAACYRQPRKPAAD